MKISVVIPTFNGKNKIINLLTSLEKQVFQDFEIIVVIDGSTDGTYNYLKSREWKLLNLYFLQQENKGRAGARNAGARAAKGDLLVFLDDDMRVETSVLEAHFSRYQSGERRIVVGLQVEDKSLLTTDVQQYKRGLSIKWQKNIATSFSLISQPYLTAANFSIPKQVFESLNGFDDKLTDCEDYDLALRAQKLGVSIYFDPEIIGWHDDFITAEKYVLRLKEYEQALRNVCLLRGLEKSLNITKKAIYWTLSFPVWIKWIDIHALIWLPVGIRYKLYDAVFFSQSQIFPK